MKDIKEISEENFNVPSDMLMDILSIIVREELKHEVIEVLHNRSLVVIAISYDKNSKKLTRVLQNIQSLLEDYRHFRSGENEEINWRGN